MPEIQTVGLTRVNPTGSGYDTGLVSHTFGGGKRHRVCLLDILSDGGDTYAHKMLTNCVISYEEGRRGKSRRAQRVFRKNDRVLCRTLLLEMTPYAPFPCEHVAYGLQARSTGVQRECCVA